MQPDVPSPIPTRPAGTPKQIADQLMAWADSHAGNPGADYYANENRYALEAIIGALQFLDVPYDNPALALLLTDASALQALLDEAWQKDPEEKGAHVLHSFCGNYRGKNGVIDERELRGIHGGLAARLILSVDREFGK